MKDKFVALDITHGMVKGMETQASLFGRRISKILYNLHTFALLISPFIMLFVLNNAQAHPIVQAWEDRSGSHSGLILDPRASYYSTNKNYDLNGSKVPLTGNGSVTQLYFESSVIYGFTDNLFIFGRLSLLSAQITSPLFPAGPASAFGFTDQLLGAAYRIWRSDNGTNETLQLEVSIPAYSNSNSKVNGTPYMGDGSIDVTLGTFFDISLPFSNENNYFLSLGAAFTKRSYGYSSAIPWSLLLKRDPEQGLYLSAGSRGQISLLSDSATNNTALLAQVTADQQRGGAGSFLINAVNPMWVLAEATAGYRASGNLYYLKLVNPLMANSAPSGFQISIGAQFDFGADSTPRAQEGKNSKNDGPVTTVDRGGKFSSYSLDATVTSTNDQLYLVKIDKGSKNGVEKGQIFDLFKDNIRIARAKVTHLKSEESALTVLEYFSETWIDVGFIARRLVK